ncbi:methyltransferase of ATP-grasp peptide maturase system [Actinoalloteichus hoggarensis]|uniref:Protein-L-isoaspartate O-methyltransferase n=1 Tax=Actinoalloteichus hoggarensis TaxID=1470176 RepID=A0A221W136_9PSEU|nr:methyltransferase domain-containing protein [Actinoalloteichus hoggarensis]ASO19494.1 Protein-L-isoaspartate O-methyltransferase [Actinoalloteichus hoggarensis]MBB5919800.1 methyltransferase of ATP-grasp peptide maturase system [Actinoalloteichus hoggarensis]
MTTGPGLGDVDWQPHAARLADELAAAGKLTSPEWRAAVAAVPRHHLVPAYYQHTPGGWERIDTASEAGLATVYSNTVLLTAVDDTGSGTVIRSSATQPGLMTRMLESLDLSDGQRVLEIGTGTGYNAALLSHRLGDDRVFSIDVEPDLLALARERLAGLGRRPTLVAGDGAAGLPEYAPFDAVIATCAVPAVPWAWVEQTRVSGVILTDLKIAVGAGSLVRLTRLAAKHAEGRFDPVYAAFMDLRRQAGAVPERMRVRRDHAESRRCTRLDPRIPWNNLVVWFLASFALGPGIAHGYTGEDTARPPTAVWIATADGSWAEVTLSATEDGHTVAEGGPRRLWSILEDTHQQWCDLDEPAWDRFGLSVTPGRQTLWLDHPDSEHTWPVHP